MDGSAKAGLETPLSFNDDVPYLSLFPWGTVYKNGDVICSFP
jgi:hypothetical protein